MNGEAISEAIEDLIIDFAGSFMFFNFVVLCFGIFVFRRMLIIKLDAPNNPVNKGNSGSLMFKFKEAIPKKPAKKKMNNAQSFLSGSEKMR